MKRPLRLLAVLFLLLLLLLVIWLRFPPPAAHGTALALFIGVTNKGSEPPAALLCFYKR